MRNVMNQRSDRTGNTQEPNATGEGADWTSALSPRPDLTVAVSRSAVFGRRSTASTPAHEHTGGDDE